jgi:hypothetical protein
MIEVRQTAEFGKWLGRLGDRRAAVRIARRVERLEQGLLGDAKPVGQASASFESTMDQGIASISSDTASGSSSSWRAATRRRRTATSGAPKRSPSD